MPEVTQCSWHDSESDNLLQDMSLWSEWALSAALWGSGVRGVHCADGAYLNLLTDYIFHTMSYHALN